MSKRNGCVYHTRVGQELAHARVMEGLSVTHLAVELGVSADTVRRWERGVGSMKLVQLRALSIILDIDLNCLLETSRCKG